ncbi:hypothetical protein GCM10018962_77280 [Dactylosporangium matsuzakiense]|uniref:zinc finger domain-containing protein n=1 Tax=Dactylosporangium matsuzakiense TaxID=53360 RepID=UPI0031EB2B2F
MHVQLHFAPLYVPCRFRTCRARIGVWCKSRTGNNTTFHGPRKADAPKTQAELDALVAERRQLAAAGV